jgi:peptide/nickel transport system permease protein/oligopeptide transport system permease protein
VLPPELRHDTGVDARVHELPVGHLLPQDGTGRDVRLLQRREADAMVRRNAAIVARLTRSSMIDVFSQDFVRTAHAKGLRRSVVLNRHALRAGLIPIVTMIGMQFTYMMGGAIVVENVFGWNGIGRLAIQAILQRDYPLIQGFILTFACVVVTVSIVLDLLYAFLDPRIRHN